MSPPSLEYAVSWGIAIGAGLAAAVGSFLFLCALFGIEWPDREEKKS